MPDLEGASVASTSLAYAFWVGWTQEESLPGPAESHVVISGESGLNVGVCQYRQKPLHSAWLCPGVVVESRLRANGEG